jgi:hypothetical protein
MQDHLVFCSNLEFCKQLSCLLQARMHRNKRGFSAFGEGGLLPGMR